MIDVLPEHIRQGLETARKASVARGNRLCVHDGGVVYRINRLWSDGFAIDLNDAAKLRGRVEIYDGARHLYQCLIVNSRADGAEMVFDFKWLHPVSTQPAADFVRERDLPAGYLTARR